MGMTRGQKPCNLDSAEKNKKIVAIHIKEWYNVVSLI